MKSVADATAVPPSRARYRRSGVPGPDGIPRSVASAPAAIAGGIRYPVTYVRPHASNRSAPYTSSIVQSAGTGAVSGRAARSIAMFACSCRTRPRAVSASPTSAGVVKGVTYQLCGLPWAA